MKVTLLVLGIPATVVIAALVLFTFGEVAALLTVVAGLSFVVVSLIVSSRWLTIIALTWFVGVGAISAVVLYRGASGLVTALAVTTGPVDPADPEALAAAETKLASGSGGASFHVALTETELNAVLQDALRDGEHPFRSLTIDIVNNIGEPGLVEFTGRLKSGDSEVTGALALAATPRGIEADLLELEVGMFTLPGIARDAVEDLLADLADVEAALAADGVAVQEMVIGDDAIVVTGVNPTGGALDVNSILAVVERTATLTVPTVTVDERVATGRAPQADGEPIYLALGDSLASAVGVTDSREGYVSQLHALIEMSRGAPLGLVNQGVAGETSLSFLRGGQLDRALSEDRRVDVVTIDIGANDLLGHLADEVCSGSTEDPRCAERIDAALVAYEENLEEILAELTSAFPDATVVFLTAYNPFSFGLADVVTFEALSDEALSDLNAIAVAVAGRHGVAVADGATPMKGTVTVTTHMVGDPADIHPNALGYDLLTEALADRLGV